MQQGLTIFVVSDATGETVERVARSALVQFEGAPVRIQRRGHVRSPEAVQAVVQEATSCDSLILHTLVSHELRGLLLAEARLHGIDAMDLMGPVLDRLATHLNLNPRELPGLFHQLAEARWRAIEAVDFAFRHDDGQRVEEVGRAEIVLVGISRTMKTPTTLYLAYRGWFAANVPLVAGLPAPEELAELPSGRVFCLLMHGARLLELRRARADHLRMPHDPYASTAHIRKELAHANELADRHDWQRVDVTGKSVEEVAREIVALLPDKDAISRWRA